MKAFCCCCGGEINQFFFDFSSSIVRCVCVAVRELVGEIKRSRRKPKLTKELSHPAKCVVVVVFCVLLCFGV